MNANSRLVIFEHYPRLELALPRVKLGKYPTPVALLKNLSKKIGLEVWMKRDCASCEEFGGNKSRKMEFALGYAKSLGKTWIIAPGGIGTNHGVSCAIFSKMVGLKCAVVLYDQPVIEYVKKNLKLMAYFADAIYYPRKVVLAIPLILYLAKARGWYPVLPSDARSTIGYINAAFELKEQIEAGELPKPKAIYVPAGSCGTLAGLAVGLKIVGLKDVEVIGTQVVDRIIVNKFIVKRLANSAVRLLRKAEPKFPEVYLESSDFIIRREQFGGAYGRPTDEGKRAVELLMETEQMKFETTYTGKTWATLLFDANQGRSGPVLFWNTLNFRDLSDCEKKADIGKLPKKLCKIVMESYEQK